MSAENIELCISYLTRCKEQGKLLSSGFPEMLTILNSEVSTKGLPEDQLQLLVTIITKFTTQNSQRASLVRCLIPIQKMSEQITENIILWFLATAETTQIMPATAALQWLIGTIQHFFMPRFSHFNFNSHRIIFLGLLEYGLIDTNVVNVFYDCFFFILGKNEKLEPYAARLVYILTKPEDVTRRQVSRILALQSQFKSPKKHLTALLSLFKAYKPEHVPEKIPSTNVESAWRKIPESLRLDLQEAAKRCNSSPFTANWQQNLTWNPASKVTRSSKKQKKLIPNVNYINIGSSLSEEKNSKSIFEIRTLDELGKHQLSLELPCNALSLLANKAGLHILTFTSPDYQSRFCYNLYNTLQNAFRYEVEKYSYQERESLLFMTAKLSRYMQQEIQLVSHFLQIYLLYWNTRDHRENIFALIEWITISSFSDLYNGILVPLRTMWESSPVDVKCEILKTLRMMITNLFIKHGLKDSRTQEVALFHGDTQTLDFGESVQTLMKFIQDLVASGLYIDSNDGVLLSEVLIFYEHIAVLEERSDLPVWSIAPPVVIYGGFTSRRMADLIGICALLLRYRNINEKLRELNCRNLFENEIKTLNIYGEDIAKGLWYNEAFFCRNRGDFMRSIPDVIITDLRNSCAVDAALNIGNHSAVLPYKFTFVDMGLDINTMDGYMSVAENYYPEVANFLKVILEFAPIL